VIKLSGVEGRVLGTWVVVRGRLVTERRATRSARRRNEARTDGNGVSTKDHRAIEYSGWRLLRRGAIRLSGADVSSIDYGEL